jgi:hypothetical protein
MSIFIRPLITLGGEGVDVPRDRCWITTPLLNVLLELAADAEPRTANVLLVATAAADLEPKADDGTPLSALEASTPVFSDFYFPDVGNAVQNVFGVDLGTPAGQTHGRFLSHPKGDPDLSTTDDLHATVLVAIPPWTPENVRAYDRHSSRLDLRRVAASARAAEFEG